MSQTNSHRQLKLAPLIALVVGSMVGGGIFSIPQNIAASADVCAVLIGWAITAFGMMALALVFQTLANRKPELNGGIYAYAKAGFGEYIGFTSAWGYWISAWLGTVSYFVLLFSTLGYFFPIFGEGNTVTAIVCASILLWVICGLVLCGIKEAAFINLITTIAKIIPIILFILICAVAFQFNIFNHDIFGIKNPELGSVMSQVRNMMLVTVWVFVGVEGAGVFSARAIRRADVGKATMLGFIIVLCLLILVSLLSLGVMTQPELAKLRNPSMMEILAHIVGPWGAILICVGLMISLLGASLSWILLCAEILFTAAKDHTMPKFLSTENTHGVPTQALWLTCLWIQIFLLVTYFSKQTYLSLIYQATSMILIPYLWSAAYAWRLTVIEREIYNSNKEHRRNRLISIIATSYAIWLLYASGLKYILLSALLYAPGVFFFIQAKRERQQKIFTEKEKWIFLCIAAAGLVAAYGLHQGFLTL